MSNSAIYVLGNIDFRRPSNSVNTISQALRDLSARVLKEGRPKIVVKIMYDRGSWEQLWNAHAPVRHSEWTPLDLPAKEDTKGLDMEVIVRQSQLIRSKRSADITDRTSTRFCWAPSTQNF